MAIKIQQYQESESLQPTTPGAAPITQAPQSAFGIQEAQAAGQMGEQVTKLGGVLANHLIEQQKYDAEQSAYDAANRLRQATTGILYGTETVKKKFGDKEYEVSSGIMNRKLTQAQDAIVDFRERYTPELEKITRELKSPYAQKLFSRQAANLTQAYEDSVIKHQATQRNAAIEGEYEAALQGAAKDAGAITNPAQLSALIYQPMGIDETAKRLAAFRGAGPEAAAEIRRKYVKTAADAAATGALRNTGDITIARKILDAAKNELDADSFNDIDDSLTRMNKRIQADATQTLRYAKTEAEIGIASDIAEGKIISKADLDKAIEATAVDGKPVVSADFYQSQIKFLAAPRKYSEAEKNAAYEEALDAFYGLKPYKKDPNSAGLGVVLPELIDSPEKILAFRERLRELAPRMSAADLKSFQQRTQKAYELAKANPEKFKKDQGIISNTLQALNRYVAPILPPVAAYRISKAFLHYMDGKEPTPANLAAAQKQAAKDLAAEGAPISLLRENTPNYAISQGNLSFIQPFPTDQAPDVKPKTDEIRVRHKASGRTGKIPREKYDSAIFELA